MKYVFILAVVVAGYFLIVKKSSVEPVVSAVTQEEAAPLTSGPRGGDTAASPAPNAPPRASDYLKKPIDRTKDVLNQVKKRNGDGEF